MDNIEDSKVKDKIHWAIEKISSNKLYEPLIEEGGKDISNWINIIVKSSTETIK
jgi:hypothetical protein